MHVHKYSTVLGDIWIHGDDMDPGKPGEQVSPRIYLRTEEPLNTHGVDYLEDRVNDLWSLGLRDIVDFTGTHGITTGSLLAVAIKEGITSAEVAKKKARLFIKHLRTKLEQLDAESDPTSEDPDLRPPRERFIKQHSVVCDPVSCMAFGSDEEHPRLWTDDPIRAKVPVATSVEALSGDRERFFEGEALDDLTSEGFRLGDLSELEIVDDTILDYESPDAYLADSAV